MKLRHSIAAITTTIGMMTSPAVHAQQQITHDHLAAICLAGPAAEKSLGYTQACNALRASNGAFNTFVSENRKLTTLGGTGLGVLTGLGILGWKRRKPKQDTDDKNLDSAIDGAEADLQAIEAKILEIIEDLGIENIAAVDRNDSTGRSLEFVYKGYSIECIIWNDDGTISVMIDDDSHINTTGKIVNTGEDGMDMISIENIRDGLNSLQEKGSTDSLPDALDTGTRELTEVEKDTIAHIETLIVSANIGDYESGTSEWQILPDRVYTSLFSSDFSKMLTLFVGQNGEVTRVDFFNGEKTYYLHNDGIAHQSMSENPISRGTLKVFLESTKIQNIFSPQTQAAEVVLPPEQSTQNDDAPVVSGQQQNIIDTPVGTLSREEEIQAILGELSTIADRGIGDSLDLFEESTGEINRIISEYGDTDKIAFLTGIMNTIDSQCTHLDALKGFLTYLDTESARFIFDADGDSANSALTSKYIELIDNIKEKIQNI